MEPQPEEELQNKSLLSEIAYFIKERKAWWLTPIILVLIFLGGIIFLGSSSPLSPLIYSLF